MAIGNNRRDGFFAIRITQDVSPFTFHAMTSYIIGTAYFLLTLEILMIIASFLYARRERKTERPHYTPKAVIIAPGKTNKVAAVKKLEDFSDTYLYIVRPVNPRVLQHLRATQASMQEYRAMAKRRKAFRLPSH